MPPPPVPTGYQPYAPQPWAAQYQHQGTHPSYPQGTNGSQYAMPNNGQATPQNPNFPPVTNHSYAQNQAYQPNVVTDHQYNKAGNLCPQSHKVPQVLQLQQMTTTQQLWKFNPLRRLQSSSSSKWAAYQCLRDDHIATSAKLWTDTLFWVTSRVGYV